MSANICELLRYDARCARALMKIMSPGTAERAGKNGNLGAVRQLLADKSKPIKQLIPLNKGWTCYVSAPQQLDIFDETVLLALIYLGGTIGANISDDDVLTGDFITTFRRIHEATRAQQHFKTSTRQRILQSIFKLQSVQITLISIDEQFADFPQHCLLKSRITGDDVHVIFSELLTNALQKNSEYGGWFLVSLSERAMFENNERLKIGHRLFSMRCLRPAKGKENSCSVPLREFVIEVNGGEERVAQYSKKTVQNKYAEAKKMIEQMSGLLSKYGWKIELYADKIVVKRGDAYICTS